MKSKTTKLIMGTLLAVCATSSSANATDFSFSFDWGSIPRCHDGSPNTVSNPIFKFSGVPEGTKTIKMKMTDLDVPSFSHGGGDIPFSGEKMVSAGAFKYQSPCPPDGTHTYEWSARALNAKGDLLSTAKSSQNYDGW
ncbi:MAG: YbhB/YbcL family Raf kinase inhibitor-like protein [Pseudomonas marincola]